MVPLKCRYAWVTTRSAWLFFVEKWGIAYVRDFVSFRISMNFCRHVLNSSSMVPLRCQYAWVTTGSAWLVFVIKSFWGILFIKSFKSKGYGARSTTTSLRGVPRHSRLYYNYLLDISFQISMKFSRNILNSSGMVPLKCWHAWVTIRSTWLIFVVKMGYCLR